jgi:hypothetical protein
MTEQPRKISRAFIEDCPPHILQKIMLDLDTVEKANVVQFPKTPVGLEREGWDIPPEAA